MADELVSSRGKDVPHALVSATSLSGSETTPWREINVSFQHA